MLKKYLTKQNINFLDNKSHIVQVIVINTIRCLELSNILFNEHKHYIQPINYLTVTISSERLRVTSGHLHTEEMIAKLTFSLKFAFKKTEKINF